MKTKKGGGTTNGLVWDNPPSINVLDLIIIFKML